MRWWCSVVVMATAACSLPSNFDSKLSEAVDGAEDTDAASLGDLNALASDLASAIARIEALETENATLKQQIQTAGTGLLDRVTALEDNDGLPADILRDDDIGTTLVAKSDVDTLTGRVDTLEGQTWVQDSDLDAFYTKTESDSRYLQSSDLSGYATQSWVQSQAYASASTVSTLTSDVTALEDEAVRLLSQSETWEVGPVGREFQTPQEALDALDHYRLANDVVLTIALDNADYAMTESLEITHPDGDRIHLIGNVANPAAVRMMWTGDVDGVVVRNGNSLGLLDGVTLDGDRASGTDRAGVLSDRGAVVGLGDHVVVADWNDGVHARHGGTVIGGSGGVEIDNVESGVRSTHNGFAFVLAPMITNAHTGAYAAYRSALNITGATIEGATVGLQVAHASDGRSGDAHFGTISQTAMFATQASSIYASDSTCEDVTGTLFYSHYRSSIVGARVACSGVLGTGARTSSMSYIYRDDWSVQNATTPIYGGESIGVPLNDNSYIE